MAFPSGPSIEALLAHREWVRALARRLVGEGQDVDDLEQLTWVAAMRQPRLSAGTLRAYLARIVRNLAFDRARERARRARHEQRAARPEATGSAADTVARAEAHRSVVEAVLALDEPYRSALLLRFFDGLKPKEIARRLSCDVEAVRTRIRRGLERLRERLGPRMELTLAPLLLPGLLKHGILVMSIKKTVAIAAVAVGVVGVGAAMTARQWTTPPARIAPEKSHAYEAVVGPSAPVAEPPRASALVVTVRAADSRGLRGTRAYRIDGSGTLVAEVAVDSDGTARFDRHDRETWVLAHLPDAPVAWAAVARDATEAEIAAPAGATLEGSLVIDGAPPARPVELSLQWEGGRNLPKPLRNGIQSLGLDPDGATCETGQGGAFRFDGLPVTEEAWIAVPADFVLASGERGCRVFAPGPFVRLEAFALPRLRGRVVFEGSGAPVPGALLHAAWTTGERSGHLAVEASPDGRFDFALPELSLSDVALAYADEAAITSGTRDLGAVGRGVHDLPDLVLPALREGFLTLRVVDGDGRPVEGAVARAEGAARSRLAVEPLDPVAVPAGFVARPSDPTGKDGLLRLPLCAEPYFARIRARGFEPLGHLVDAPGEETLVLRRTTLLNVRVEAVGGPSGLVVRLSADRPLFAFETDAYEEAGFSESSSSDEGDSYVWLLDGNGEARVPGLGADLPFTVSCLDAFGAVLAPERVALCKGEARDLLVRVDAPARAVRGVVRDASGAPVEGAEAIGWSGAGWERVACGETDAEGRFVLEGARTAAVRILVLSDGFVPRLLDAATDREHAIRLERGRRIRARVEDPSGAPVQEADVRVELDGFHDFPRDFWCGAEIEPGLYEIDGLPAGEVTIVVRTREREASFVHKGEPEGRFVLGRD